MITASAVALFEARVIGFPTGELGQVGVRILDNEGGTVLPRTTLGITEDPAGSGSYVVVLRAPRDAGDYTVFWDWDGGSTPIPSHTAGEDLIVTVDFVTSPPVDVLLPGALGGLLDAAVPHFALPFRFAGGRAVVNEQGSPAEISDAVAAVALYTRGERLERPTFGVSDQTFREGGADPARVLAEIHESESRATLAAAADATAIRERASRITIDTEGVQA